MKKISSIILLIGLIWCANAQAPYRHSIGATVGNTIFAVSYKTFFTDNIAFSVDAGLKWTLTSATYHEKQTGFVWHEAMIPMTIEVNPNVMYEGSTNVNGLHWLAGAGLSAGYAWSTYHDTWGTYKTYYRQTRCECHWWCGVQIQIPAHTASRLQTWFRFAFQQPLQCNLFRLGSVCRCTLHHPVAFL